MPWGSNGEKLFLQKYQDSNTSEKGFDTTKKGTNFFNHMSDSHEKQIHHSKCRAIYKPHITYNEFLEFVSSGL